MLHSIHHTGPLWRPQSGLLNEPTSGGGSGESVTGSFTDQPTLTWMPLAFLARLRPQRQPTRFTGEIWVFCQALGAPIPLLCAHAVARTQCACKNLVLDQYGDRVLTCKKHTGAIVGHDHVMNVSAQLARNSGLTVRVNRKVDTTAADNNKQGDVQAMEFVIPGFNDLV